MKVLGRGWQYTVYDIGDGRVLKKYHGTILSYLQVIRNSYNYPNFSIFRLPKTVKGMKEKAILSVQFLRENDFDNALFGRPIFLNSVDYEQDKVLPIEIILRESSLQKAKDIIDSFILFQKKIIGLGFIDKSFNICKNFGVTTTGEIILLDLGELFFENEKIKEQIINRAWSKKYVIEGLQVSELKEYFLLRMESEITVTLIKGE